ncbi:Uma2 family endonuclease [Candidatus Acetothermia bacterium]|jgi:Uma2 family endonuclease|nr:Uma2 family endonuclease [Candidatus Acetothermia bacterium]MCI2431647.1 Uma2 family endonuclease [Candidatus Acetothermia bacterium]MCI2436363.1 Uma2 family endonuclease [Candidatus Acetothermia bacterium]
MSVQITKRLFTVTEYYQMAQAGILSEDDRVELLEGEIIEMSPISSRHASCVSRLNYVLQSRVQDRAIVSVQNPVRLSEHSEPQPDLTLLRPRADFYGVAHPQPQDVLLLVEVCETSTHFDRRVKLPLYAKAGIPEVWLVDLTQQQIEVYRSPSQQGYSQIQTFVRGQSLTVETLPEIELNPEEILG